MLLDHLALHRDYYDLTNPGFLDRAKHRLRVNGRKLVEVIRKVCLQAVLLPDEGRIVVDESLPQIKREWPVVHEIGHRVMVWHHPFFYGETAQTLQPDWQEELEAEANYAAGELLFCGRVFREEARDTHPEWSNIESLRKRYGNKSYVATLRRYVEHGPDLAMAMLVSTPPWMEPPADQISRCRHFVPSPRFAATFPGDRAASLMGKVNSQAIHKRGGKVADFTCGLVSGEGKVHEMRVEAFFNTHYLVTLFVDLGVVRLGGEKGRLREGFGRVLAGVGR
jgi:hypothetical protein